MAYKIGSLFAGVGGICLGFKRASEEFELTFANEFDDDACLTYSANFNHNLIKGDIEKILNPNLLIKEKEFLETRLNKLLEAQNFVLFRNNFNEKFVKESIKKLNTPSFVSILMKGNFELTDSIKKQIKELNYIEEDVKKFLELQLIQLKLITVYSDFQVENEYNNYQIKHEEILSESIDILTAGFPCQAFSIAGQRKGFEDHRGELFYSVVNLVNQLEERGHGKPRILFLENVKNLVSHDDGNTFKVIKNELEKLGYILKYKVLNTYKYTILPQNRERIFVICFLNEKDSKAFGSLSDLVELHRTREELKNTLANTLDYHVTRETNPELYYTKEKYPKYFDENGINLERDITEMHEIYQIRRGMYVRQNQSGVCPTLTANMGTGGHNVPLIKTYDDGIRKLSPKDCFNLQGFRVEEEYTLPTTVINSSLYKQAGNAVSVDVIELLAKKILNALQQVDTNNVAEISEKNNMINEDILNSTISKNIDINILEKNKTMNCSNIRYNRKYFKTKKYGYFNKRILRNFTSNIEIRETNSIKKIDNYSNNENCEKFRYFEKIIKSYGNKIEEKINFDEETTNGLIKKVISELLEIL